MTCSDFKTFSEDCSSSCDGCCKHEPPTPPSPAAPGEEAPRPPAKGPPLVIVILLSAAAGALLITVLIFLVRRCLRRARKASNWSSTSHATIQLSPHSTHFSDENLESLGHYHDKPPRRPSFTDKGSKGSASDRYGLVGKHAASSSDDETHTLLYGLIAQWRACLQRRGSGHASPAGERPGHQRSGSNMSSSSCSTLLNTPGEPSSPAQVDVLIEPFIEAFSMMLRNLLTPVFGTTMVLAVKNDEGNIEKVRPRTLPCGGTLLAWRACASPLRRNPPRTPR